VSLAGRKRKGKSCLMENPRWSLWQRLRILVDFEIPQQRDEENHNSEHKNAKAVAGGIRTATG
jgi:hypothetical protein